MAIVAACGTDRAPKAQAPPPTTPSSTSTTASTTSTTSTTPATPQTTSTTTTVPGPPLMRLGARGDEVRVVEARLAALGYWPGAVDGVFDDDMLHATVALQKTAGIEADGVVGPITQRVLDEGVRPSPRSGSGHVVEIDLQHQILLVVDDGAVQAVFDTSTGRAGLPTPKGTWTITRQIDGLRRSPLGLLYRPKYFHSGVAIHGFTTVPPYPASHSCVRVTYHAMDQIWTARLAPLGTPVWVY
jgi:hypothetical protein